MWEEFLGRLGKRVEKMIRKNKEKWLGEINREEWFSRHGKNYWKIWRRMSKRNGWGKCLVKMTGKNDWEERVGKMVGKNDWKKYILRMTE